jgi:hypothetical protein
LGGALSALGLLKRKLAWLFKSFRQFWKECRLSRFGKFSHRLWENFAF